MKVHMNFPVSDLGASVAFYGALLDAKPTKHHDDYALFIVDRPPLEIALDLETATLARSSGHFGVVLDSVADVDVASSRLESAGYAVDREREETCCYAVQTKVWASDPDGRRWETYFVHGDVESRDGSGAPCCL